MGQINAFNHIRRKYMEGQKVRINNYQRYGKFAKEYGEVYQILHDTIIVLFDNVGINIAKEDIRFI